MPVQKKSGNLLNAPRKYSKQVRPRLLQYMIPVLLSKVCFIYIATAQLYHHFHGRIGLHFASTTLFKITFSTD